MMMRRRRRRGRRGHIAGLGQGGRLHRWVDEIVREHHGGGSGGGGGGRSSCVLGALLGWGLGFSSSVNPTGIDGDIGNRHIYDERFGVCLISTQEVK